jgi:hypothetical protein
MDRQEDRHQKEAAEDEHHREALETAEIAGARGGHDQNGGERHAGFLGDAEIIERQGDADELGDDGQRIEEKKIDDAEGAPELAEAFEDEAGMADPRDRAETQDHLLVHIKNGNQEKQRPQERGAIILPGLGIGAEGAGVIVADHDDETWAENGEKSLEPVLPAFPRTVVVLPDGAEGAVDVAGLGFVENGRAGGRHIRDCIHGSPLLTRDWARVSHGAVKRRGRPRPRRWRDLSCG